MESEITIVMDKKEAVALINGFVAVAAHEKWQAFDKFVDSLVDKTQKIRRITVIKGLILEAQGHKVKDFRNKSIKATMRDISEDDQVRVHKKFLSIKSLISQAVNKSSEPKPHRDKRNGKSLRLPMVINLPISPDEDTNVGTFDGVKVLLSYCLDAFTISQLSELEVIVRVAKSKIAKGTERVLVGRA